MFKLLLKELPYDEITYARHGREVVITLRYQGKAVAEQRLEAPEYAEVRLTGMNGTLLVS